MFIRFDMIHERDRRTDGRTHRHRMTAIAALMHSIARQKRKKARPACAVHHHLMNALFFIAQTSFNLFDLSLFMFLIKQLGNIKTIIISIIIINVKIIVTLSQKKCCRSTVQNVMSKFAVNTVQQTDSAIMSGLQRMP